MRSERNRAVASFGIHWHPDDKGRRAEPPKLSSRKKIRAVAAALGDQPGLHRDGCQAPPPALLGRPGQPHRFWADPRSSNSVSGSPAARSRADKRSGRIQSAYHRCEISASVARTLAATARGNGRVVVHAGGKHLDHRPGHPATRAMMRWTANVPGNSTLATKTPPSDAAATKPRSSPPVSAAATANG